MKIIINGSKGGGWADYVTNGTKRKPRDKDLIELLEGNLFIGERVTAQGNWKENEYHIILGFKGKPPKQTVREATKEFEKYFMAGFEKDEYHLDAVAHFDTDDSHVHIRIPKMNLKTGTQLQLYWHKKDVNRINLIRDHINNKFYLDVSVDEKPLIQESQEIERIQKWREEREQVPFNFKTKKGRDEVKLRIAKAIKAEHEAGTINNLEELRTFFSEKYTNFWVSNEGHDYAKDFYYFTIEDEKGQKLRLEGDFYSEEFWINSREQREQQFKNNKREPKAIEAKDVSNELAAATEKRIKDIEQKYQKSRAKANKERGREEARATKYRAKIEKEEDEPSRAENTVIRERVEEERADNRSTSDSVQIRDRELVSEHFGVHKKSSGQANTSTITANIDWIKRGIKVVSRELEEHTKVRRIWDRAKEFGNTIKQSFARNGNKIERLGNTIRKIAAKTIATPEEKIAPVSEQPREEIVYTGDLRFEEDEAVLPEVENGRKPVI